MGRSSVKFRYRVRGEDGSERAEAELTAAHTGTKASFKVQGVMEQLLGCQIEIDPYMDAMAAIKIVQKGHSAKLSHMRKTQGVSVSWLREQLGESVQHVGTRENIADALTKMLTFETFDFFRTAMGIRLPRPDDIVGA